MITEKDAWTINGYLGLVILAIMSGVAILSLVYQEWVMSAIFFCGVIILASGFTVIQPNQSVIVQFAGSYAGTHRHAGIVLFVPFSKRISVSLCERMFKSEVMQVHDINGKPVAISLVLLFKIVDAAKAVYDVENVENYIAIQSEMSVRGLMTAYSHTDLLTDEVILQEMTHKLKQDLYNRLKRAGIALTEIRVIPAISSVPSDLTTEKIKPSEKLLQLLQQESMSGHDEKLEQP